MLRLNLLRELSGNSQGTLPPPPYSGLLRRMLTALLGLLLAGALLTFVAQPKWLHFPGTPLSPLYPIFPAERAKVAEALEVARQDSVRRVEALQSEASRRVAVEQEQVGAWLDQLETVLPAARTNPTHTFTLTSFTAPGSFVLRGTAVSAEALSALQESLILFPGMDLRQSVGDATEESGPQEALPAGVRKASGIPFLFEGTVNLAPSDSTPPKNRVLSAEMLDTELEEMIRSASSVGITLTPPQAGAVSRTGVLRLHPFRLSGTCDSAGFSAVSQWLAAERERASSFGIQRLVLSQRDARRLVFLDILAFTR